MALGTFVTYFFSNVKGRRSTGRFRVLRIFGVPAGVARGPSARGGRSRTANVRLTKWSAAASSSMFVRGGETNANFATRTGK